MKRRVTCLLADLGWRLLPLAGFRFWLLRTHLDACPHCRSGLAARQEVRDLFPEPEARMVSGLVALAAGTESKPEETSTTRPGSGRKKWLVRLYAGATAAATIILLAGFALYLSRQANPGRNLSGHDTNKTNLVSKVSLAYVQQNGQPADTYIYQTADPEMVIIWVERSN